jgi:signal peptidase I
MTEEAWRRRPPAFEPPRDDDDVLSDQLELEESLRDEPAPAPNSGPQPASAASPEGSAVAPSGEPPADPPADPPTLPQASNERRGRHAKRREEHRKAPWWELPALIALAIVIAILVKTFLVQPFYIPSQSMEKTLHGCPGCSGDRILVNKIIYDFRDPHPGDIVVFHAPPGWDTEPGSSPPSNPVLRAIRGFGQLVGFVPPDGLVLVKRVIAIGGQTVQGIRGHVRVRTGNGPWHELDEPFVFIDGPDPKADFGPVTVPKGRLWVMGDHRNESEDSRWHCGPGGGDGPDNRNCNISSATVPVNDVIGKAFVIAWPPSRWRTLGTPSTFKALAAAPSIASPELVLPLGVVLPLHVVLRRRRRRRRVRSAA